MSLFDSGAPLANVALSDTFNTWRTQTNEIITLAASLASNNIFTGTNNTFNGTLHATTANFTTLQADAIDFDGDLTVDTVTANTIVASAGANLGAVGDITVTGGSSGQALITDGSGNLSFSTISSTTDLAADVTGTLPIVNGGTGATTASGALSGLGLTASATEINYTDGVTSNIQTQLDTKGTGTVTSVDVSGGSTGLTTSGGPITGSGTVTIAGTLAVSNGGTGATSLTGNSVLIGNGTGAVQTVAPGSSGNILTSTGSGWQSSAPGGGGLVEYITSVTLSSTASTFTLDNAAFSSSTYEYLILEAEGWYFSSGTGTSLTYRYRNGGSNLTGSHYDWMVMNSEMNPSVANNDDNAAFLGMKQGYSAISDGDRAQFSMRLYHQQPGFPHFTTGVTCGENGNASSAYISTGNYDEYDTSHADSVTSINGIQFKWNHGHNFAVGAKLKLYGVKES
tara:strand:+ start:409 stop:1770 length:1362 start_codon:yes stop_codon:yes gene_type:complete